MAVRRASHTRHHAKHGHRALKKRAHVVRLAHHHVGGAQAAQAAGVSMGGGAGRSRVTRTGGEFVVQ